MDWNVDNVLVLSPHTDDMEIGAGGAIRMLVESGAKVKSIVFSDCVDSIDLSKYPKDILRKECAVASKHLGIDDFTIMDFPVRKFPNYRQEILEVIYHLRKKEKFDLVFTTWKGDIHQDHQVVAVETIRAFMKTKTNILAYPIIGNCPGFIPNVYVPLDEPMLKKKIELQYSYESQKSKRHYFKQHSIEGWMAAFGIDISVHYAEAFALERLVIDDAVKK